MAILQDNFGRRFSYVRLSITEACNFRCQYCLPNGFKKSNENSYLSVDEIRRLVVGLSELGVWKIRLTGGEPTIRRDLIEIISTISSIPGIKRVALTTNGYRLMHTAKALYEAGLNTLNVSVDSLDEKEFETITGCNKLSDVLKGVEAAQSVGFDPIKINVVLLKSYEDSKKLESFLKWIRNEKLCVRFIELMQTADNHEYFKAQHLRSDVVRKQLLERDFQPKIREAAAGPAQEYFHPDYLGTIGLISPYSKNFCESCNRLRITSRGDLRLCLFGKGYYPLRPYLQTDAQKEAFMAALQLALPSKKISHQLQQGDFGDTKHLASIGG